MIKPKQFYSVACNKKPKDNEKRQLTFRDQNINQVLALIQNVMKVYEIILINKHQHLATSIVQTLSKLIQASQQVQAIYPEAMQCLQRIHQKDLFLMIAQEIKCCGCSNSHAQYLVRNYDQILNLILWYKSRTFSILYDYKSFFKLNQELISKSSSKITLIDSLWSDSIKKSIKSSWNTMITQLEPLRQSSTAKNQFQQLKNAARESIQQSIKKQLLFYQISFELLKLYQGTGQNEKKITNFYQKYVRTALVNDLVIIGKIIEDTYKSSKMKKLLQIKLVQPLKQKLQKAYVLVEKSPSCKPYHQSQKQMKTNRQLSVQIQNSKFTELSCNKISFKRTQSKILPTQNIESNAAQKKHQQQQENFQIENLTTIIELQEVFKLLKNLHISANARPNKDELLTKLKEIRIINLKGRPSDKKKMVDSLLQLSCTYPELIDAAFQNSLVYFQISQLPQKFKSLYQNGSNQVKNQYQKSRRKRTQLRTFYKAFELK